MSVSPPLTDLPIETADSGFYKGFSQIVTVTSKLLIGGLVVWAIAFPEQSGAVLAHGKGFHELMITNVPPGWENFLWEVEEDLPSIRKTYNPESRCLRLKIRPTYAHNCIAEWISASISRACAIGFLNPVELDLLLLQQGTSEFNRRL